MRARSRAGRGGKRSRHGKPRRKSSGRLIFLAMIAAGLAVGVFVVSRRSDPPGAGLPATLVPGAASGHNLLIVTLDTTRADHLGCYGREAAETPVLDGIASRGVLFTDAVTVAPVTLPAHASIFTGLYPPDHGVRKNGEYRLAPEQVTLAELLQDNAYDTAAFVSAFVLDSRFGLDQGFGVYDDAVTPAGSLALSDTFEERSAAAVTGHALRWLETRPADGPFFLWIHYFDPHQPYAAPASAASRFPDNGYDAEIAYVDRELGRLTAFLERSELSASTVVVVVGDHGEGLGEHGETTHDFFVYESVMRVPLILSAPGVFGGSHVVDDVTVSVVDLFPTLLDLLGIDAPRPAGGTSLLRGGLAADRSMYMESITPYLDYGWAPLFALRRHGEKYIKAPRPEYYDLRADPGELENLLGDAAGGGPAAARAMSDELDEMLAAWPEVDAVASAATPLDPESLARLEALGYVGSIAPDPGEGRLDPKDMLRLINRIDEARAQARAGRVPQALATLREVAVSAPGNRFALGQMARLYTMLGRLSDAEDALRACLAIKPSTEALTLLAQVLIAGGHTDEAAGLADRALALDSRDGMAHIVQGDIAAAGGRFGEADRLYRRAREVDPYRTAAAVESRLTDLRRRTGASGVP